jgi:hypothetical protein
MVSAFPWVVIVLYLWSKIFHLTNNTIYHYFSKNKKQKMPWNSNSQSPESTAPTLLYTY